MTGNSNFVLRWEIDNATATLATGKAESGVFNEGGFEWKIGVQPNAACPSFADFVLSCDHRSGGNWKCALRLDLVQPTIFSLSTIPITFNDEERTHKFDCDVEFFELTNLNEEYNINGKVIIEFRVNIISSECLPPIDSAKFSSPNELSNVTLVIGEKKVKVSKDMLAIHSPVFAKMFFGDFAEKGKEEVQLKDVVHEQFLDILQVIYLDGIEITDRSVPHLLKLADQFQMERVMNLSKKHLIQSKGMDVMKKLLLADQYRLTSLKDHCLSSFASSTDLTAKIKSSPEFDNFSDMQAAICRQIKKLP